jgi:ketosteroid isomerase-like protein
MSAESNTQAVQAVFAAFSRGDMHGALAMMNDDVDWWNIGPAEMGYTTPRRGRASVEQFFREVDELFDHEKFEPGEFVAQGDNVVVAGTEFVRAKKTGKSLTNHWCMIFTFKDGKIVRWRCYEDTGSVMAIMRPD